MNEWEDDDNDDHRASHHLMMDEAVASVPSNISSHASLIVIHDLNGSRLNMRIDMLLL